MARPFADRAGKFAQSVTHAGRVAVSHSKEGASLPSVPVTSLAFRAGAGGRTRV